MNSPNEGKPLPEPSDVLAMDPKLLIRGDQDTLRDRRYALLNGLAHLWPSDSPDASAAQIALTTLSKVLEPVAYE